MEGKIPLLGEKFPQLDVVTTMGKMKLPDDFSGKWLVFFSHLQILHQYVLLNSWLFRKGIMISKS